MSLTPGVYKSLLGQVSTATHEILTRKKLSEQSRGAASVTAGALRELLKAEPKLASVKRQLDQARSMLSRPSPGLDEASTIVDAAQAKASTSGKKTSKKKASGAKAAASTAEGSGKKVSKKKSSTATKKRASSKKIVAAGQAG